jgi:hypothetical protein
MTRYIDADALVKAIDRKLLIFGYTITVAEALRLQENVFRQMIDAAPTADVVPRAEYDVLDAECSRLERYESRWCDEVFMARAKVAREIFAEIESSIKQRVLVVERLAEDSENEDYYTGCADAYCRIGGYIAELKKKYTEGE